MAIYKPYRVEYTFRQPRHEDTFTVVNEKVISDSLILQHLLKHCMKLVHWEVREL